MIRAVYAKLLSNAGKFEARSSYAFHSTLPKKITKINVTTLLPDEESHFVAFKGIITDHTIALTSSWIDKWFGIDKLKLHCDEQKAISMQEALNVFFLREENLDKLRRIYRDLTMNARRTGLGYYRFDDENSTLLGGGALAPLSQTEPIESVDVALHILGQHRGIGSKCMAILFKKAFEELAVKEIFASSIISHPISPIIAAKNGMIASDSPDEGMKYYYIDKEMWEARKNKEEKIIKGTVVASTYYR